MGELPPPGSYEVEQSYLKSQIKPTKAKPRTQTASRKHNSFMTAASRFAPARDNNKVKITDPDNPVAIDIIIIIIIIITAKSVAIIIIAVVVAIIIVIIIAAAAFSNC
nr:hypothetical protein BaRGS_023198 [Batillaria attramentaria]